MNMAAPTNVQKLPALLGENRVETGAVQFGNDWPGLFIRGDNAHSLALWIRRLAELLSTNPDPDVADAMCHLANYADIIDQDVPVQ